MNEMQFVEAAENFQMLVKLYYASFGATHPEVNKNEMALQLCERKKEAADKQNSIKRRS